MSNAIATRQYGIAFRTQESLAALRQTAQMFTLSSFVKANELKGNSDFAVNNAMIICEMAQDFNVPVYSLLNSVYFIHGTPAFTSQFFISRFNMTGLFSRISYELSGKGEDLGCVASCIELATKQKLEGSRVTMRMAHESRWSPIWDKLPEQMLRYRSATFLIRSVAPEVMLGFYTVDEQRDIANAEKEESFQPVQPQAQEAQEVVVIETTPQPEPQPEKPLSLEEQFQQLCLYGNYDCEKILAFTLEAYRKSGVEKTPEECMRLFLAQPELLERAQKKIDSKGQAPVAKTEEAPVSVENVGASKEQPSQKVDKEEPTNETAESQPLPQPKKLEEFAAYMKAGHKLVVSVDAESGDPYGIETRAYLSLEDGAFNADVYHYEHNGYRKEWHHIKCFKKLEDVIEAMHLNKVRWTLLEENTKLPR